jgi:hypothetical protein
LFEYVHEEILTIPTFIDYINVGSSNWMYGDYFNSEELQTHVVGAIKVCLLFYSHILIISIIFISKARNYKLQITDAIGVKISSK